MLGMDRVYVIRHKWSDEGLSIRQIARDLGVSRSLFERRAHPTIFAAFLQTFARREEVALVLTGERYVPSRSGASSMWTRLAGRNRRT